MIITIDGPSSSGKSSVAKEISKIFDIVHIDSGAIYRAITFLAINFNCIENESNVNYKLLTDIIQSKKITFEKNNNSYSVAIDGVVVESKIRNSKISKLVSIIAAEKSIRDYVLIIQHQIASRNSIVMDGRDIGSVVFPNAKYKFYIDASIKERSHRRWTELKESEFNITIENVEKDLINRDFNDTNRSISPLTIPENAVIINSDDKSIKNVVDEIVGIIKSNS